FLVVRGIEQVVFAFALEVHDASRALMILSGALSLILAMLAFRHFAQGSAVLVLAICIGVGLLFRGCAETV
ncbi:MAG TPA: HdeD family acid-resistance protein, partial [Mycobacterium sp.]|nr:HdeD family acid-resistance protein [Mycobacterium sp.]